MRTFFILVPTFYPHYILRAGTIAYVEVLHDRRICIKTSALNSLRFSINSVVIPITRPVSRLWRDGHPRGCGFTY